MSDPSEEKPSSRVRMHFGEFPLHTSPEVYVSESLVWFSHLGILFAAQNFHHSLLCVHPPEELPARKVRSLFYGCVLLPICLLSGKWFAPRTAVLRSATLASTTVVTSSLSSDEAVMVVGHILRA